MKHFNFVSPNDDTILWASNQLRRLGIESSRIRTFRSVEDSSFRFQGWFSSIWFKMALVGFGVGALLAFVMAFSLPERLWSVLGMEFVVVVSVLVVGFATWEGLFIGVQRAYAEQEAVSTALDEGLEAITVDIDDNRVTDVLNTLCKRDDLLIR